MKLSLTLRPRRALTRAEAWGCFTANLALPGAGSLAAGRAVGYGQMTAAFLGLFVSAATAIPMFQWGMSHGFQLPADDPLASLQDYWLHVRWPLAGVCIFAVAFLWAMTTSLAILAGAPKGTTPPRIPPANS
jgi:hypothetical protein